MKIAMTLSRRLTVMMMVSLVCPTLASADNASLEAFFSATVGSFRGEGFSKVIQSSGQLVEEHYSVEYTTDTDSEAHDTWNVTADWLGDESDMHSTNLNTYVVSGDNLFLREYGTTFPLQITESTPNTLVYEATQVTASGVPMDTTVRLALHDHHLTSSAISTMNGVTVSDVEFSADY